LDAGVIQPWQAASLDQLQNNTRAAQALRPWLIGLALVGYLVLVGYERRAALWDFKRLFARRKP
jgi:hypothetical protein